MPMWLGNTILVGESCKWLFSVQIFQVSGLCLVNKKKIGLCFRYVFLIQGSLEAKSSGTVSGEINLSCSSSSSSSSPRSWSHL